MYRHGSPLNRPAVMGQAPIRRCNSHNRTQHFMHEPTDSEQIASATAVDDFHDTDDEISAEMLLTEEFTEVLDLSQSSSSVSQCSTQTESDTCQEQLSPDLFPSDQEDLSISSASKRTESSQSSIDASVPEKNNNVVNPGRLTLVRRRVLARLARTRAIQPNITLYDDISNDQMFSLCTMTSLDPWEEPGRTSSALGSFKLDNMAPALGNLDMGLLCSRLESVVELDSNDVTEEELVPGLAQLGVTPGLASPQLSVAVNTEVETTVPELPQWDWLPSPCSPSVSPELPKPGCSYHLRGSVASPQSCPVPSRDQETWLDVQPPPPETTNTDKQLEFAAKPTILENTSRSLLVNNIDIYRHIRRGPTGKYQLQDVPFLYVIVTGVITNKSLTRKSITQLEVDDGSAVINCLFDDLQCLPEHRTNFHKYLDSWKQNLPLFRPDPVFDDTFHFLREYAKRLFQETPLSGDLNLGDEVTIVGKVYDSKKEGRVIYHKFGWRSVDVASRENCGYVQDQFAKRDRHF